MQPNKRFTDRWGKKRKKEKGYQMRQMKNGQAGLVGKDWFYIEFSPLNW
jgi:hypothetical protein